MSDEVITEFIKNSGKVYKLSADDIIYLSNQGVSQSVISTLEQTASAGGSAADQNPSPAAPTAPTTDYFLSEMASGSTPSLSAVGGQMPFDNGTLTMNYWNIPQVVSPGQVVNSQIAYTMAGNYNGNAVTFKTVLAEWQPNSPIATLENGILQGSPGTHVENFAFAAPTTPGTYRLRLAMTWAYAGIQHFYGDGPKGDSSNPGVGPWVEVTIGVVAPPTSTSAAQAASTAPLDATPVISANPQSVVNLAYFQSQLSPYGNWVNVPGYGLCWQPVVDAGWRPYYDAGHWEYTDVGWYWQSDYPWGDIAFHYGRWAYVNLADDPCWVWVPGYDYAPAWVVWRHDDGDGYVGWAPLPVGAVFVDGGWVFHGVHVAADFAFGLGDGFFTFVAYDHLFFDPHMYRDGYRRFIVPRDRLALIYRHSLIENRYRLDHGRFVNEGLARERMAVLTHHDIRPMAVRDLRQQEEQRKVQGHHIGTPRPPSHNQQQGDHGQNPRVGNGGNHSASNGPEHQPSKSNSKGGGKSNNTNSKDQKQSGN